MKGTPPLANTFRSSTFRINALPLIAFVVLLAGCETVVNNNLEVQTTLGKVVTGGKVLTPLGSQPVAGQWVADIPITSPLNTAGIAAVGSVTNFQGVTAALVNIGGNIAGSYLYEPNVRMPAYWDFVWEHPSNCVDIATPPYPLLPNPAYYFDFVLLPGVDTFWTPLGPTQDFTCWINSPANPDFVPSNVSTQFVLDDALPSALQVHAFSQINAAASITNLRLFSMSLTNPANVTAESIAADGNSAVFPYPKASNGATLPAGPYIATITTDPVGANQTTNGMEAIYVAHDDTSYPSAFGVDIAIPAETTTRYYYLPPLKQGGGCAIKTTSTNTYGGSSLPLVTLPSLGQLAVGSSSKTISVGLYPTVVIAYNNRLVTTESGIGACGPATITNYTGSQSALVVNTGSNTVSLVNIGEYSYPTGTIAVGSSPVAATINPAGTLAYIANYGSATISEVDLQNVYVTRTLNVMAHPTTVAYDTNGNLWVGGQGSIQLINTTNWAISATFPVDGTVTGMSYDMAQGGFVSAVLQNGTVTSPSNGGTLSEGIAYRSAGGASYSTTSLINVATGNTVTSSIAADTAPYAQSSLAAHLAFPGQTAFNPPIYTSSSGDMIATANGDTFTVSVLSSGKVLVGGTTPYPIRGIKLTSTMLYLTMPESNSLVTLPMQLP